MRNLVTFDIPTLDTISKIEKEPNMSTTTKATSTASATLLPMEKYQREVKRRADVKEAARAAAEQAARDAAASFDIELTPEEKEGIITSAKLKIDGLTKLLALARAELADHNRNLGFADAQEQKGKELPATVLDAIRDYTATERRSSEELKAKLVELGQIRKNAFAKLRDHLDKKGGTSGATYRMK